MKLEVKRLDSRAKLPLRATEYSAGFDLCACIDSDTTIAPGETVLIKTGLSIAVPNGYAGLIYARSGLATKHGILPANAVGVIDSDYRGEVMVALRNQSTSNYVVVSGERIAQLVITPVLLCEIEERDALSQTVRGEGGFGSTGKK